MNTDWTFEQGLEFVRKLETAIKRIYSHYHVALGGSVLHKGTSSKDLDVFIYPHKTNQADRKWLDKKLTEFGVEVNHNATEMHEVYGDSKEVLVCEYQGKRVDIFILS